MGDLKPCPFCGSAAAAIDTGGTFTGVRCYGCHATGEEYSRAQWRDPKEAERRAIVAWNRRAEPKAPDAAPGRVVSVQCAEDAVETWAECTRCAASTDRIEDAYSDAPTAAWHWNRGSTTTRPEH